MYWLGATFISIAPVVGHLYETAYGFSTLLFGIMILVANVIENAE